MRRAERPFPLRHAVALGLLQGPTELLPISSSAHTALVPWLAGWSYERLDGRARKSFELALHAGGGLALAIEMRGELRGDVARLDRRRGGALALSLLPPALAGAILRGPIERRLGTPRSIAFALAGGGLALALADGRGGSERDCAQAGPRDGLALGVAQALALIPGVSRSGAALTAARARGFRRGAAHALAWEAALPVLLGASAVEGVRLARAPAAGLAPAAAGGLAAFASTLVSARALRGSSQREWPLLPYALYRALLATFVLARLRDRPPGRSRR